MDRVIVCFSNEKENLSLLGRNLKSFLNSSTLVKNFHDADSLCQFLENKSNTDPVHALLLYVSEPEYQISPFISKIDSLSQYTPKLIIGNPDLLRRTSQELANTRSLLFLARPCLNDGLQTMMQSVLNQYNLLQELKKAHETEREQKLKLDANINHQLENLIEANVSKDKFLSILSHDLKNPFAALLGISEILVNDWIELDEEEKLEMVRDIRKTSEETYRLLEELLEWTKSQKEKLEVSIKRIQISRVVESSIKISENRANSKHIDIRNGVTNGLKINADEHMISTVFRNLIGNAVKYTQPGGKVDISVKKGKNECTFCVADNGEGIDKPYILELFSRHINGNGNHNGKKKNGRFNDIKGLGLYLCKEFVELNGGQIWLETAKGQGSKFYFTVPY